MLKQRLITGLILAPLVLCGLFLLPPAPFAVFVAMVTLVGAWEWANLSGFEDGTFRVAYALVIGVILYLSQGLAPEWILMGAAAWWVSAFILILTFPNTAYIWQSKIIQLIIGCFVLVPFWSALVLVRSSTLLVQPELSVLWVILYMLLMVWAADVGAYFAGKAFGKSKLAPRVSPGKSWAGAWGGVASVVVLSVLSGLWAELSTSQLIALVLASVFTAALSIIGDLSESMFKRHRGIKDSSNLLPGHGGVMDRIDSLTAAVPVFVGILLLLGWMA